MKISTTKLQSMMAKTIKGVGNNKLIPITCLIAIKAHDGVLTIVSTDGVNYLYVRENIDDKDDFYVCIRAEQFAKLVAKTTSEFTTLTIKSNSLEVKGNGTYQIEIPLDEMGETIQFPNPLDEMGESVWLGKVTQSQISKIINTVKTGIADTLDKYPYTNYYLGDIALATDTLKVCAFSQKILTMPKLINANMVDLLSVVTADETNVKCRDDKIVFETDDVTIYGLVADGIDDFRIDSIKAYLTQDFPNKCRVNRGALLQLLDRIALFVGAYDDGAIRLTFKNECLTVESKQTNGVEIVAYAEPIGIDNEVFPIMIDINMLQSQVKAQESDILTIHFGTDNAIKIVDNDITSVIALII